MEQPSCLRKFARYTSLSVLGTLGVSCYILADTFFISRGLGADGLTALNLAIPVYNFIFGAGLMLGMGGATKFSICKSQGDEEKANHIYLNTLYLGGLFSVLFLLPGPVPGGGTGCSVGGGRGCAASHLHLPAVAAAVLSCLHFQQYPLVLCPQRWRTPAFHGSHDHRQPLQYPAGLSVHFSTGNWAFSAPFLPPGSPLLSVWPQWLPIGEVKAYPPLPSHQTGPPNRFADNGFGLPLSGSTALLRHCDDPL